MEPSLGNSSPKKKPVWSCLFLIFMTFVGLSLYHHSHAHQIDAVQNRLEISTLEETKYKISWVSLFSDVQAIFPKDCVRDRTRTNILNCENTLNERSILIKGLSINDTEALARIDHGNGIIQVELLSGSKSRFVFRAPQKHSMAEVASTYFILGVEHILIGFDHLLFIFCLLLILPTWKQLAWAITSFTLAHSITLILSTLKIISLPITPVETIIALSIVFLATEYAKQLQGIQGWTAKRPWLVCFVVGLLHGLGFASVLNDIGLPNTELSTALILFNLGVETGQIAFIAVMWPLITLASHFLGSADQKLRKVLIYSIGGCSAFWFIERLLSIA